MPMLMLMLYSEISKCPRETKLASYKNSGTKWALFLEYFKYYMHLIYLKLENLARRWRTVWCFQIFLKVH